MRQEAIVYIALQSGSRRLVVDGPLEMLGQLMVALQAKQEDEREPTSQVEEGDPCAQTEEPGPPKEELEGENASHD